MFWYERYRVIEMLWYERYRVIEIIIGQRQSDRDNYRTETE